MQTVQADPTLTTMPAIHCELSMYSPAFWQPRFADDGDILRFTPLLFWLSAALQPSRTTVLGLGNGVACFAICQAIERLQVEGTCTGIHFSGQTQVGIPDVVKDHALQFYEGLLDLRVAQGPADMPWPDLDNQDLLLIDLQQSNEWPVEALNDLRSRLSAEGCLVVYGLRQAPQTDTVHLLRNQLSQASCVSVDIGAGVSILCNNPNVLADLIDASRGKLRQDVLTMFVRLGNSLIAERSHEALRSKLAEQQVAVAKTQHCVKRLEAETAELSAALEARGRKASQYQALYFDSESELKTLRRLEAEVLDAQAERQKKDEALAERDALTVKLRQSRETHYRETAALTVLLEDQREAALQEAAALRQHLDELRKQAEALALDNSALLSSTSWKITSPLRRIASKLRGHGYRR